MVNYADRQLFADQVGKTIKIIYSGGYFTNADLMEESFTLEESLCSSEELRFGSCEASCLKFTIGYGATPLIGEQITVQTTPDGASAPFQFGVYKVASDKPTADRRWREVVAYDAMNDLINSEVSDWYNTLLPDDETTVTLKQFRDSFFTHMGVTQETQTLPNDSMVVTKTIDPSQLSSQEVLRCICEINGCFGHINRQGKFEYVFLKGYTAGLYPSETLYPSEDLYPSDPSHWSVGAGGSYISAKYEDYDTAAITKLQVRQSENDIGAIAGTGTNCYVIQNNFLVYGMSAVDLGAVAQNVYDEIKVVAYCPATIEAVADPCLEVGDGIEVVTDYKVIATYILQRTLRGIQALFDTYTATGPEYQPEQVNSLNQQIIQLRGKTNELDRNVEETKSTITNVAEGLQSQITQNADAILLKVSKGDVSSEISQEAGQITISSDRLEINSTNFTLSADGTISAKNANLSGQLYTESATSPYYYTRVTGGEVRFGVAAHTDPERYDQYGYISSRYQYSSGTGRNWIQIYGKDLNLIGYDDLFLSNSELDSYPIKVSSHYSGGSDTKFLSVNGSGSSLALYAPNGVFVGSSDDYLVSFKTTSSKASITSARSIEVSSSGTLNDISLIGYGGVKIGNSSSYMIDFETSSSASTISSGQALNIDSGGSIKLRYKSGSSTSELVSVSHGTSNTIQLGDSTTISCPGTGDTLTISSYGNLSLSATGYSNSVIVGGSSSSNKVGFFGNTGAVKQSVSKISTPSSATTTSNANKINEIIDALKAYNLM